MYLYFLPLCLDLLVSKYCYSFKNCYVVDFLNDILTACVCIGTTQHDVWLFHGIANYDPGTGRVYHGVQQILPRGRGHRQTAHGESGTGGQQRNTREKEKEKLITVFIGLIMFINYLCELFV